MKLSRVIHVNQKALVFLCGTLTSVSAIFLAQSLLPLPVPFFIVISDSMVPAIQAGDVVVLESVQPQEIAVGDVIAFKPPVKTVAETLVHRVTRVNFGEEGALMYVTKGDANQLEDSFKVEYDDVVGRVLFKVPYIGQAFFLFTNPLVLILVVILGLRRFL